MSYDYYLRHMTGVEQSREEFIKGRFYTTRFQRNDRKSIAVGERVWYNKNNCNTMEAKMILNGGVLVMLEKTGNIEEWMINSLQYVKNETEELRCAIHGVLLIDDAYTQGFFGLTDHTLVIALPNFTGKKIKWKANISFKNIKSVEIKRTKITHQVIISLTFDDGKVYGVRAAKKVHGMPKQTEQLQIFIQMLTSMFQDGAHQS
ncbi:MAG: hypothetical protein II919_02185 [Lachnospiraceae bacterium]|nr:hypothetical protein [Lachnospiraceae bacterium]